MESDSVVTFQSELGAFLKEKVQGDEGKKIVKFWADLSESQLIDNELGKKARGGRVAA